MAQASREVLLEGDVSGCEKIGTFVEFVVVNFVLITIMHGLIIPHLGDAMW